VRMSAYSETVMGARRLLLQTAASTTDGEDKLNKLQKQVGDLEGMTYGALAIGIIALIFGIYLCCVPIKEHTEQIEELQTQVGQLQSAVTQLQEEVDATEADIADLEAGKVDKPPEQAAADKAAVEEKRKKNKEERKGKAEGAQKGAEQGGASKQGAEPAAAGAAKAGSGEGASSGSGSGSGAKQPGQGGKVAPEGQEEKKDESWFKSPF